MWCYLTVIMFVPSILCIITSCFQAYNRDWSVWSCDLATSSRLPEKEVDSIEGIKRDNLTLCSECCGRDGSVIVSSPVPSGPLPW